MTTINSALILTKDDYSLLLSYLKQWWQNKTLDRSHAEALQQELKRAKVVDPIDIAFKKYHAFEPLFAID